MVWGVILGCHLIKARVARRGQRSAVSGQSWYRICMQPDGVPETQRPFGAAIFIGPDGVRAGWRVLLFLLLWGLLAMALSFLTDRWVRELAGIDFPVIAVAALGATWMASRLED